MSILHSINYIKFTDDLFEHAIELEIGMKFVDDISFVQRLLVGNCTTIDPADPIEFCGTIVKIISAVLLTVFGVKVIEQLRKLEATRITVLAKVPDPVVSPPIVP